jgi:hypothetical protein
LRNVGEIAGEKGKYGIPHSHLTSALRIELSMSFMLPDRGGGGAEKKTMQKRAATEQEDKAEGFR